MPLRFRSTAARVAAWAWMVFAALNMIDIVIRGRDTTALFMAALLIFGCGLAYDLGIRPVVRADDSGVTVRNPLRDVVVPWRALRKVEGTDALVFHYDSPDGKQATRAWVMQTSPRAQAKVEARARREAKNLPKGTAEEHLKGRTPTMYAAEQINDMAERHRKTADDSAKAGSLDWSPIAVGALAVPGILLVAALLIAVLT